MTLRETGNQVGARSYGPATSEKVFLAAVRAFTELGYDQATMDDVAAEAGVARRTAFNHFPAKSDIAVEWSVRRAVQAFELAREASSDGDRVRAYFHELAKLTEHDWDETRQLTRGWLRSYGSSSHRRLMPRELSEWIDEPSREWPGEPLPEEMTYPALMAEMLYDVYQGALLRRIEQPLKPGAFICEVDAIVALVLGGGALSV